MNIQVCKMSDTGLSERCQKRVYDEGQIQNRDRQTFFLEGGGGCVPKNIQYLPVKWLVSCHMKGSGEMRVVLIQICPKSSVNASEVHLEPRWWLCGFGNKCPLFSLMLLAPGYLVPWLLGCITGPMCQAKQHSIPLFSMFATGCQPAINRLIVTLFCVS